MFSKELLQSASTEQKKALLLGMMQKTQKEYPLSYGQEALWFLQQQNPNNYAYNVAACLSIDSSLDPDCLRRVCCEIVDRHPVLRSRFIMRDGKLRQQVQNQADFVWRQKSVTTLDATELHELIEADYQLPFDLASEPVLRAYLYQQAKNKWILLLVVHHIAIDGWSLWQILDEVQALYSAMVANRTAKLSPLVLQYRDFVIKQRLFLKSQKAEQQLNYWRKSLSGDLPVLQLPTDKARPSQQTFNGASYAWELPSHCVDKYKQFCRERCVTPFVFGLACYFTLLHRLANQDDILVAAPTAGRSNDQFANVVGYFVNPLPIRACIDSDMRYLEFLNQVQANVIAAQEHADIPFPVLVEKLSVKRDASYPVLCQAMFVYQKLRSGPNIIGFDEGYYNWGEFQASHYPLSQQDGQFDLGLELLEGDKQLTAHWKYNRDLFEPQTIKSIAAAFEQLILGIIQHPGYSIGEIRLVDMQRIKQSIPELLQAPKAHYPVTECLHEKFTQAAQQYATNTALVHNGVALTYAELEQRSNFLAEQLQQCGIKPGEPLGIALERGIELVIALIGVLKAGGCYIPMDPHYPSERLRHMADDAAIRFLLTNKSTDIAHMQDLPVQRLLIDVSGKLLNIHPDAQNLSRPSSIKSNVQQLAYILYTSGSTGRPKGVQVSHANVMRLFDATQALYNFNSDDVWTLFHSYAFDFSVWELWGALLHGGKIVIVPYTISRSPQEFRQLLIDEKVTVLNQTPSAFQQLMRVDLPTESKQLAKSLRWIIFGGEALDLPSLQAWFMQYGERQPTLVNMYGITETTVHVTQRILKAADANSAQSLIGEPLSDLNILILDQHRQPVPIGFPGEIYVGGAGVSHGYLNRTDLTAARFVDNPFAPGETLYRTGDLARRISATDIAYMGRIDDQVQLRGFRIELGEIEAQLSAHKDIAASVVLLREDMPGDVRLVAYYLAHADKKVAWAELRKKLQTVLPDYMLPSTGIQLTELPLTVNGKIDRNALPQPDYSEELTNVQPRDEIEQRIANIWREILCLSAVGIHDNFFEIGGHSLLAAQLTERLQREFDYYLSLSALLSAPSIAELALMIRQQTSAISSPLVALQTRGEQAPIFAVPGGGGNALYYQPLAQALGQQRPFYAFQAKGLDGETAPLESVEKIAAENITALRDIQPHGPYLLLGHCFGGIIAYEMAQQLIASGEDITRLFLLDVPAPLPEHRPPSAQWNDSEWLLYFIDVLQDSTGVNFDIDREQLLAISWEQQLTVCRQYMETTGILPSGSDSKQVQGMVAVFKTNSQIAYRPGLNHQMPVTLLRASEFHPAYDYSAAEDHANKTLSSLGWRQAAAGSIQIQWAPGHHISMLLEPNVAKLADLVQISLSEALQNKQRAVIKDDTAITGQIEVVA